MPVRIPLMLLALTSIAHAAVAVSSGEEQLPTLEISCFGPTPERYSDEPGARVYPRRQEPTSISAFYNQLYFLSRARMYPELERFRESAPGLPIAGVVSWYPPRVDDSESIAGLTVFHPGEHDRQATLVFTRAQFDALRKLGRHSRAYLRGFIRALGGNSPFLWGCEIQG